MRVNNAYLKQGDDESDYQYKQRICSIKDTYGLTWFEVASILNESLNQNLTPDAYRKFSYTHNNSTVSTPSIADEQMLYKEKVKLNDIRAEINGALRAMSREETLKEIANEVVSTMSKAKILDLSGTPIVVDKDNIKSGILCISDWHYGLDVNLFCNVFNPDVARRRIIQLLMQTIKICQKEQVDTLYIVNLGDMISGQIHLPLRLNSRVDVISQTIQVSELLAEFIGKLSGYIKHIKYLSVTDNHSRINPNKKESLQPETFVRIIDWYLMERFKDYSDIEFILNDYGDDIANFKVYNHNILAAHGDKDKQNKIIPNLNMYTQTHCDMILSAHMHHFSANEHCNTELYYNGSLIGTDDYAGGLRVHSAPSQLLIVCTPDNVSECIYKIKLD